MRRHYGLVLCGLLVALLCMGLDTRRRVAPSGPSYLLSEGFEGTGYESGGWSENNNPNEDSTSTTCGSFVGSQWFETSGVAASVNATNTYTGQSEAWAYVQFCAVTTVANNVVLELKNSTTVVLEVQVRSTNVMRLAHGATATLGTFSLSDATKYHLWVRYQAGTGSNGQADLWIATTDTKPGTPDISITTGTATANADTVTIGQTTANAIIMDKLRIDDVDIGSGPS